MEISAIGIHPVEAADPCHLVELMIRGTGDLDLMDLTQETHGERRDNWQVPYEDHLLSADGTSGKYAPSPLRVRGEARVAFFFHFLDLAAPLLTPSGPITLPAASPRPDRLNFMQYEPVN